MESSVAPFPHRRTHLSNRTYRSLLHHLCSSFDREPRVSLATPAVLHELVLRTEIAPVSPGETCKPPENLSMVESKSNGVSVDLRGENSQEKSLMLGDVFDGIDLQDASVGIRHTDFFDSFELMINENPDFVPESCVNLFEALDVNDYDGDGMVASLDNIAKQPLDFVQNVVEKPNISTESDKKVEEVPKSAESNEVKSSGFLEACDETVQREMELEKPVDSTPVLVDSVSRIVEDDDVEEGEISGDDNDDMLVEDDEPVERHEECQVSRDGIGNSHLTSHESFGKELGVENLTCILTSYLQMDPGTSIKKRSAPSKDAKARKRAKARKKRAKERIALGVKKLKLKPVAPKPKPIKYCRHYLKERCHESFCHRGDICLFSHKGTPQSASDTPSANVTASSTNITAASFSPQKTNKQSVREAIAKLPGIQARVSSSVGFLKPLSQSNHRNPSDALSPKINEPVTHPQVLPLRKPSVAPKGMSFLSLDKTFQEDTVKVSPASKRNTDNSDNQTLKQSQLGSSLPLVPPKGISFLSFASEEPKTLNREPQEPSSSRNLKTTPSSHIQSSLLSAMKLAAEFESAKVERRNNDPTEAVNKSNVTTVNTTVTRNSGNISSKILEFLSSFSQGKN
ncbi:predicted protein [Arabidopsis lyrata subsp. lyrata]|uniref:Predicted protein n=1 Tax=Arabidopsis lyrata subsp. lyrata TaxID=81972 RepID=D7MVZ5_ARALL|nr:predicted protein [Arabidopsis lyrata subsp. lyrata]